MPHEKSKRHDEILTYIGKHRTKEVIYDSRGRPVVPGTEFELWQDLKNAPDKVLVRFPYRKTLLGFYEMDMFDIDEEKRHRCIASTCVVLPISGYEIQLEKDKRQTHDEWVEQCTLIELSKITLHTDHSISVIVEVLSAKKGNRTRDQQSSIDEAIEIAQFIGGKNVALREKLGNLQTILGEI